jgi:hypothetical protein
LTVTVANIQLFTLLFLFGVKKVKNILSENTVFYMKVVVNIGVGKKSKKK